MSSHEGKEQEEDEKSSRVACGLTHLHWIDADRAFRCGIKSSATRQNRTGF